jgi:hypothetical protein
MQSLELFFNSIVLFSGSLSLRFSIGCFACNIKEIPTFGACSEVLIES